MGLDTTHDCWHGAYSAFMRWRQKIAEVAGLPPLELMEGFFSPIDDRSYGLPTLYHGLNTGQAEGIKRLDARLPIKWSALKPDPLHVLLSHSDCDGDIAVADCMPIADRLEQLLPLLPPDNAGGHIGDWREKTQCFIDGLRAAAAANENVNFH